jgi:hypothetical protein
VRETPPLVPGRVLVEAHLHAVEVVLVEVHAKRGLGLRGDVVVVDVPVQEQDLGGKRDQIVADPVEEGVGPAALDLLLPRTQAEGVGAVDVVAVLVGAGDAAGDAATGEQARQQGGAGCKRSPRLAKRAECAESAHSARSAKGVLVGHGVDGRVPSTQVTPA